MYTILIAIGTLIPLFLICYIIYQLERISVNSKKQTEILKEIALKQGVNLPIINNIINK